MNHCDTEPESGGLSSTLVAVIPVYRYADKLESTIVRIQTQKIGVIVVNDGSGIRVSQQIEEICQRRGCQLISRKENGGKGAAIRDGLISADDAGYSHVFQVDGDGQHRLSQLDTFLSLIEDNPNSLILGTPVYDHSVPLGRRIGRWATHVWIWINTLSFDISDSMCGYRIYPLASIVPILKEGRCGQRMDFDPEICVRAHWKGVPVINWPIEVVYPKGGVSSFRLLEDNWLISKMHTRLFFGMLIRMPVLLCRKFMRRVRV